MSHVRVQCIIVGAVCQSHVYQSPKCQESSVSMYSVSESNVLEFSVSDSIIRVQCVYSVLESSMSKCVCVCQNPAFQNTVCQNLL